MSLNACQRPRIPGPAPTLTLADLGFGGTVDDGVTGVAADPSPQQTAIRGAALRSRGSGLDAPLIRGWIEVVYAEPGLTFSF